MSPINWLVQPQPQPEAEWQLFCLPPAGGGTATYDRWPTVFGPDIEVTSVCLPGRERNLATQPFHDMTRLATELAEVIHTAARGRFALFGHSFGAALAFAVATRLESYCGPDHLFVSSCGAPHLRSAEPRRRPSSDAELVGLLRTHGGVPDGLLDVPELLELVLPALRADLAASASYRPSIDSALTCEITALGGASDSAVRPTDLDRWRELTTGHFAHHQLPGGHFYLIDQLPRVYSVIRAALDETTPVTNHHFTPRVQGARS